MLLNDLIFSSKDLRTSLVRQYVAMNFLRKKINFDRYLNQLDKT